MIHPTFYQFSTKSGCNLHPNTFIKPQIYSFKWTNNYQTYFAPYSYEIGQFLLRNPHTTTLFVHIHASVSAPISFRHVICNGFSDWSLIKGTCRRGENCPNSIYLPKYVQICLFICLFVLIGCLLLDKIIDKVFLVFKFNQITRNYIEV